MIHWTYRPQFQVLAVGGAAVARFTGGKLYLDGPAVTVLEDQLLALAREHGRHILYLDFFPVAYLSGQMLGLLIRLQRALQAAGGRLVICNLTHPLFEVLQTTGLAGLLDLRKDTPAAMAAARDGGAVQPAGILVAETAAGVRSELDAALRGQGFAVWLAETAKQAVWQYRRHREEIGLVLLDAALRGREGPQTLAALRQINPEVRCCLLAGGDFPAEADLRRLRVAMVVQKPLRPAELVAGLWRIIQPPAQSPGGP
jgi:anti-anti-sigma factor